jgi:hypothetical protein
MPSLLVLERPKTKSDRYIAAAYHEAGHAVAHVAFRVPFRKAMLVPSDDYLGGVGYKIGRKLIDGFETGYPTPSQRDRLERQVICLLAGPLVERNFIGRRNNRGASSDRSTAADLLLYLAGGSSNEVVPYARWLEARARDTLLSGVFWPAVQSVANALLERKMLDAAELRELVHACLLRARRLT